VHHYKTIANPRISVRQRQHKQGRSAFFEIFAADQLLDISVSQWIRYLKNGFDMTPTLKEQPLR
jgi:hypothetical protein